LIKNHKDLKYYRDTETGLITFEEGELEKAQREEFEKVVKAQQVSL
jgi:hypothetical protein